MRILFYIVRAGVSSAYSFIFSHSPAPAPPPPAAPPISKTPHRFSYGEGSGAAAGFAGEAREKALTDISFALKRGESLGIIGSTGCGKSTIIALLTRFYDAPEGGVFVDGRDVRTYEMDELA